MNLFLLTILLFLYIFNTPVAGLPPMLTTIRIASVGFLLMALFTKYSAGTKWVVKLNTSCKVTMDIYTLISILFIHVCIILLSIGVGADGKSMVPVLINMFFFFFISLLALIRINDSFHVFMKVILMVSLVQTFFVWLCLLSPSARSIIDRLFLYNVEHEEFRELYAGGIACITAPGCIKYSLGFVSCIYYILNTKGTKFILFILVFILLSITATMIARTGLLIALTGVLFLLLAGCRNFKIGSFLAVVSVIIIVTAILVYMASNNVDFVIERFTRLLYLFDVGVDDAFLNSYVDGTTTVIPPITGKTLYGTAVFSGTSGNGVYVNADGGFVKNYVAFGLIATVLFYIIFFYKTIRLCFNYKVINNRIVMLFFITMIMIAEFKEWIIFDMYMLCIFCTTAILLERDEKNYMKSIQSN